MKYLEKKEVEQVKKQRENDGVITWTGAIQEEGWLERSSSHGAVVKSLPANAGDVGSIPEWRRPPEEGNKNPL